MTGYFPTYLLWILFSEFLGPMGILIIIVGLDGSQGISRSHEDECF